jgi:hypothetical protein
MAELTLRLVIDPETGKKDLWIDYHSDADATPDEHEEDHRALVRRILSASDIPPASIGRVWVRGAAVEAPREPDATADATTGSPAARRA